MRRTEVHLLIIACCCWVQLLVSIARAEVVLTNCNASALLVAIDTGEQIVLGCDGTIRLTNTVVIRRNTVIDGTGRNVVLDGNGAVRLFEVLPNAKLTLKNVTLTGGQHHADTNAPSGRAGRGGAIHNRGTLFLIDSHVAGNTAAGAPGANGSDGLASEGEDGDDGGVAQGGAIFNEQGVLVLTNTTFIGNSAVAGLGGNGGAGGAFGHGNHGGEGGDGGTASGGAVFNAGGSVEIYDCTFSSNHVAGAVGGFGGPGVGLLGFDGEDGDAGAALGGAIYNREGTLHIRNSTFSINSAIGVAGINGSPGRAGMQGRDGADGSDALGGGIFNENGSVIAVFTSFTANTLIGGDGGNGGEGGALGFGGNGGDGGRGGAVEGGGIYSLGGKVEVANGTFAGNVLIPGDGGLPGQGGGFTGEDGSAGEPGRARGPGLWNRSARVALLDTGLGETRIGVQKTGTNGVVLTWPADPRWQLETHTTLEPASSWRVVTNNVEQAGAFHSLSLPLNEPTQYFRLRSR